MVGLALHLAKYNVIIVFEFRKCGEINLCGGKHVIVVILDVSSRYWKMLKHILLIYVRN